MTKSDNDQKRLKHNDTGGHLGGTKFGQAPGTTGPNHAKPGNKEKQRQDGDADGENKDE